jgi:hypothetical protein
VDTSRAVDRRVFVSIGPSGGRPAFIVIDRYTLDPIDADASSALAAGGRWLVNKLIFRGGWTVHIDAPDADPARIRCRSRAAAHECGQRFLTDAAADAVPSGGDVGPVTATDTTTSSM